MSVKGVLRQGSISWRILDHLKHVGPGTCSDLAEALSFEVAAIRAKVSGLRKLEPKQVYIDSYQREAVAGILYIRAVYAFGNKPDAKKPKPLTDVEYQRRYRQRKKTVVSSVFDLGRPNDSRRLGPADSRRIFSR